jgi:photosystem II stability/assembly factor-like uncharacterized protein
LVTILLAASRALAALRPTTDERLVEVERCASVNALVVTFDSQNPSLVFAATAEDGLFRSLDGGATWANVASGAVLSIAVSPMEPGVVFAGTRDGVLKSRDSGRTWALSSRGLHPPPCGPFPCVSYAEIRALAVDPALASRVLAAGIYGLFESRDAGVRWLPVEDSLSGHEITVLRFDPAKSDRAYAGTGDAGLWRSDDSRRTWHPSSAGLGNLRIHAIALDPVRLSRIYVATDSGIYGSEDGGESWLPLNNGIPIDARLPSPVRGPIPITDIAIDSSAVETLYAASSFGGVYRSGDSGRSWVQVGTVDQLFIPVNALALDPNSSARVLAGGARGGVFESADGGTSWQQSFDLGSGPRIDGVSPAPVVIGTGGWSDATGESGFFLMVSGVGFRPDSIVLWKGSPRPTQYLSCTRLMAAIPSSDASRPGSANIYVLNSEAGLPASHAFTILIVPPEPPQPGPHRDRATRVVVRD